MLRLSKVDLLFCSLPDGATIMSTTNTPSLSRSQNRSLVTLFSMYDPEVSNTTLFPCLTIFVTDPSAPLTFATRNVIFLSCVPSDVDMSNVFSPSFSTVVPSTVVWNTPRLDPSDSNVLWFGIHVLGVSGSAAPLSTTDGCGKAFTRWTSHTAVRFRSNCSTRSRQHSGPSRISRRTLGRRNHHKERGRFTRFLFRWWLLLLLSPSFVVVADPVSSFLLCGGGCSSPRSLCGGSGFLNPLSLSLALLMVAASPFSVFCGGGGGGFPFPLVRKISTRGASFFFLKKRVCDVFFQL